jgi:leader peptidase (prepilin peptidase)/N-methyltransferase
MHGSWREIAPLIVVLIGIAGLLVGSFLNVLIARVPEGRSIVRPGSRCPGCGAAIRPYDNIPVLSWLLLRGRCRDCGRRISAQYPLVEAATAAVWVVLALWAMGEGGVPGLLPLLLVLSAVGLALGVIDVQHHRLPDALVLPLYPMTVVGLLLAGFLDARWPVVPGLAGAVSWLALIGGLWVLSGGRGMGFGDVKLAPVLGATLGWVSLGSSVVGLMLAFVLGAVVGLTLMAMRRAGATSRVPFGPFLLGGALLGLLVGPAATDLYLSWI